MNRSLQPPIKQIEKINIQHPEKYFFSGGIPVYFFKNTHNIISLQIIFNAGTFVQDMPLQAAFTVRMLREGSKNYKSKKIAEALDFLGVKMRLINTYDSSIVALTFAKKHIVEVLKLLSDILVNPLFPEKELKTALRIEHQNFLISQEKVTTLAQQKFKETLFGTGNYYGYRLLSEDFRKLKPEHLLSFHKKHYTTTNGNVIISGNLNDTDILAIEKALAGITKGKVTKTKEVFRIDTSTQKEHFLWKKGAVQSALRIGRTCCNRMHKDDKSLRILNMVLGGYFGSRLMTNLREDKGYTYGIYSSVISYKHIGYFSINTQLGNAFLKDGIKQINIELERLQNHKIPDGELDLVKNYMLGSLLKNFDGSFNLSNVLAILLPLNLDLNYYEELSAKIKSISAEELLKMAQKYLTPSEMFCITAGGNSF